MAPTSKPHVVIFPFMAQGHTIPLLDLSRVLSRRGLRVTIVATPRNASAMKPYISHPHSQIRLVTIPFPSDVRGLPRECENMAETSTPEQMVAFLNATRLLREPFEAALKAMILRDDAPTCVVSDSFLGWTNALCRELGVPRLVFNGMGVFTAAVKKYLSLHHDTAARHDGEKVDVRLATKPSFDITRGDLPMSLRVRGSGISSFVLEAERLDMGSWAVIANSFTALEKGYVSSLEELYGNGTRAFCVGPLFMHDCTPNPPSPNTAWADWLTRRGIQESVKSVIYVSFGSQATLCDEQLDELAHGLEMSGEDYIWLVRSHTWSGPVRAKGLILREWVDQKWVLGQPAIGGFLSHCGWNSALEGLANGVPFLTWPMHAEQHLNAKFLVDELNVGISLEAGSARDGRIVGRREICDGVKELMRGLRGKRARDKASRFGRLAASAVEAGGSSCNELDELVELINHEKMRADPVGKVSRPCPDQQLGSSPFEKGDRMIRASNYVAS